MKVQNKKLKIKKLKKLKIKNIEKISKGYVTVKKKGSKSMK